MKKIVKYFYTKPTFVQSVNFIVDEHGNPVANGVKGDKRKALPRLTICGVYDQETNKLSVGISRCSPKDLFNKEVGRQLALKRAETSPTYVVNILPDEVISHVFFSLARTIEERYMNAKYIKF